MGERVTEKQTILLSIVSVENSTPSATPDPSVQTITRQQWKWSALAGMASYLDAGSIVALGAGLAIFQSTLDLSDGGIGLLAAIGPNALGCAFGAIFGGWLGDKLGRKFIYQYDLMLYAFGILLIALSVNPAMLFFGTLIVGVAVGIDVPTSLALVGELAPDNARGKLLGFTQVAWCLGPVIVLWLAVAVAPLGMLGIRIVFLHLFLVAIVTWALRRGLKESSRWKDAAEQAKTQQSNKGQIRSLFKGTHLKAMIWTVTIYLFWNLAAGTAGVFNPYFIKKLNAASQAASVGLSSSSFIVTLLVTVFVFMRFSDRSYKARKTLWGIGALMQITSYALFLFLPFTIPTILMNIVLFSGGAALAGEAFYKVFSQELFPTLLRGTAQGFTFGVARVLLGVWSFFVPMLATAGIGQVAALLTLFLSISGVVGFMFMPDTSGKSLEQIERERS